MAIWYRNGIAQESTENYGDLNVTGGMNIDSGTLIVNEVTNSVTIGGDATITGDAAITGAITGASFTGPVIGDVTGNLTGNVTGATWTGDLAISGDLTVNGNDIIYGGFGAGPGVGTATLGLQYDVVNATPSTLKIISQNLTSPAAGGHNVYYFDLTLESDGYTTLKSINNKAGGVKIVHDPHTAASAATGNIWLDANRLGAGQKGHVHIGSDNKTDDMSFYHSTTIKLHEDDGFAGAPGNVELSVIPHDGGTKTGLLVKEMSETYDTVLTVGGATGQSGILNLEGGTITGTVYDALINFRTGNLNRGSFGYIDSLDIFALTDGIDLSGGVLLTVQPVSGDTVIRGDLQVTNNKIKSASAHTVMQFDAEHAEFQGNLTAVGDIILGSEDKGIIFEGDDDNDYETRLLAAGPTGTDIDVFLPNDGCTLVGDDTTQILSNKSLASPVVVSPEITTSVSGSALNTDLSSSPLATELPTALAAKTYADSQLRTQVFSVYNCLTVADYHIMLFADSATLTETTPSSLGNATDPATTFDWSGVATNYTGYVAQTYFHIPYNCIIESVNAAATTNGSTAETVRFHVMEYELEAGLTTAGDLSNGALKAYSNDITTLTEERLKKASFTLDADPTLTKNNILIVTIQADDATDECSAQVWINYKAR